MGMIKGKTFRYQWRYAFACVYAMWSLLNTCVTKNFMKPDYSDIIKDLDASVIVLLDKLKRYLSVGKASVMVMKKA